MVISLFTIVMDASAPSVGARTITEATPASMACALRITTHPFRFATRHAITQSITTGRLILNLCTIHLFTMPQRITHAHPGAASKPMLDSLSRITIFLKRRVRIGLQPAIQ